MDKKENNFHLHVKQKKSWQRFTFTLIGCAIVLGAWRWAILLLYTMPPDAIGSFTSLTNNAFYVIGTLVVFFVTGKTFYDWKNLSSNTVFENAQQITQDIKEKIDSTSTNINIDAEFQTPELLERYADR